MRLLKYLTIALLFTFVIGVDSAVNAQSNSSGTIWNSTFYNNSYLGEPAVLTRQDSNIAFSWGAGSPNPIVNEDYFSARFTTSFNFLADYYRFRVLADDGVRVIIDNSIILIDTFDDPQPNEDIIADARFAAGVHTVQVDYREVTGLATLRVGWLPESNPGASVFVPASNVGVTSAGGSISPITNWTGRYYNNTNLLGAPTVTLSESSPSHNWGAGSPIQSISEDNFSAEWAASFFLDGTYDLTIKADDGVRVYIDNVLYIDEWHLATTDTYRTRFSVAPGNHTIRIEYYEADGIAFLDYSLVAVSSISPVTTSPTVPSNGNWLVQYYPNAGLAGDPILVQTEGRVSRTWGNGAPLSTMSPDSFSVRFTSSRQLNAGTYLLRVRADDGVRVYIDNTLYIDEWHVNNGNTTYTANVPLTDGIHTIIIEYYESSGDAFIEYSLDATTSIVGSELATDEPRTATVIASKLNVRSEPSVFGVILQSLARGETYPVVGQNASGTWIQLNINGSLGWVNATYTDEFNYVNVPIVDETVVDVIDSSLATLSTTANVNMRRGPRLEYGIIRIVPENTVVNIEARTIDSDWWQISYRGTLGWVTDAFVNVSPIVDVNTISIGS